MKMVAGKLVGLMEGVGSNGPRSETRVKRHPDDMEGSDGGVRLHR